MPRGKHPKSLANLKPPIAPEEVRNPLGVNRKRPWTERYSKFSEQPLPEKIRAKFNLEMGEEVLPKGATWADASTVRRLLETLESGGTPAAKEIVDRIEGKSTTFEEERVDAKEAHVYLLVGEGPKNEEARTIVGNVELTGGIRKPRHESGP
jgi:hypothetical protein